MASWAHCICFICLFLIAKIRCNFVVVSTNTAHQTYESNCRSSTKRQLRKRLTSLLHEIYSSLEIAKCCMDKNIFSQWKRCQKIDNQWIRTHARTNLGSEPGFTVRQFLTGEKTLDHSAMIVECRHEHVSI